jgi:hypothetical protein
MTTIDRAQSGNGEVRAFRVTPQERKQLHEDAAVIRRPIRKKAARRKIRRVRRT